MKKYIFSTFGISFLLSLLLFSCSDKQASKETTSPDANEIVDKIIVQKDYIRDPQRWEGPRLWPNGFKVEQEISSLGAHRTYDATVKSVRKYKAGEVESRLPRLRAAEWGYTVLNLQTGQYDGSGRQINNSFLDNLAQITTREQALTNIMEFVKQQYAYKAEDGTWVTIEQGNPWYSMNGHHCWHHYAGEEGAEVLASEIGENIHGYQLHIAMNRGAAKQYNTPWTIDFSAWHGAGILDYSSHPIWTGYSGVDRGHSISLLERSMLMSFMSGADAVVAEAGGAISFYDELKADGTYDLTPYGEVFQHLTCFSEQHQVGITYTPVAVILNKYHGMDRQPTGQKAFGKFPYNDGDFETFNLIETIWPNTFSVEVSGNETGAMVNGPTADQYDFLLQNAPLELLRTYRTVLLSGAIDLSDTELQHLNDYVSQGGVLLVSELTLPLFSVGSIHGTITEFPLGKGKIVGFKSSALTEVVTNYLKYTIPFKIDRQVQYFLNVKDGAYYLTLINNSGVTKRAHDKPVIDPDKKLTVTVEYTGYASLKSIKEIWNQKNIKIKEDGVSLEIELGPGEGAVIEYVQ